MKNISIYAYSTDTDYFNWLQFLLAKVEANICICTNETELKQAYTDSVPDVLLIDDEISKDNTNAVDSFYILEHYVSDKTRGTGTVFILSREASNSEYVVDYLFKGADYVVEHSINVVELIARILAIVRYQKNVYNHVKERIHNTRQFTAFNTMEKVLVYLNEHMRPIVQSYIDNVPNLDKTNTNITEYINSVHNGAKELTATINAIRDDVYELMTNYKNQSSIAISDSEHLEELFQKNLDIINSAYNDISDSYK